MTDNPTGDEIRAKIERLRKPAASAGAPGKYIDYMELAFAAGKNTSNGVRTIDAAESTAKAQERAKAHAAKLGQQIGEN